MASPERVAARYLVSSDYLSVGTIVLYGKYKNHVGKIVRFSQDKWGNPTVEIEPVPKGRKSNKIMGLFKMWRKDIKDRAVAEQEAAEQAAGGAMRLADQTADEPEDEDEDWED